MNTQNTINKYRENHANYFNGLVAALSATTQPINEEELLDLLEEFGIPYSWLLAKLTDTSTNVAHLVTSFLAKETAGIRGLCLTLAQRTYKGDQVFQNVQLFDRFNAIANGFKSFADLDDERTKELFYIISNLDRTFCKQAFEHAVQWMLFKDADSFLSDAIEYKQAYFQMKEITEEVTTEPKKKDNLRIFLQGISVICPGCIKAHNRKLRVMTLVVHDLDADTFSVGSLPGGVLVLELDNEGKVVVGKKDYDMFKDLVDAMIDDHVDAKTADIVVHEVQIKGYED